MIKVLIVATIVILTGTIGFYSGKHFHKNETDKNEDLLTLQLVKDEIVKAALLSDRISRMREGKIDELVEMYNHEIDSSIYVTSILLNSEFDEETQSFAYGIFNRIAKQRERHPHAARTEFRNRIQDALSEAERRGSNARD